MAFTRNEIIERATAIIGVRAAGEDLSAEDTQEAVKALNMLIGTWQADGIHLFSRETATLFLQPGQIKYQLGGSSTDHATESYTSTTLSAAGSAADTTISLSSTTGLAAADKIGVKLDDGSIHWDTVVTPGATVITDGLAGDAASGNTVYFYTTDIGKPLRIPDAQRVTGTGTTQQEVPMVQMARADYDALPNKQSSGAPVQFYYDPKQTFGYLYIWPAPTSAFDLINLTRLKTLDEYASSSDIGVFPNEWTEAIVYNLAARLLGTFGRGAQMNPADIALAGQLHQQLKNWDQGPESIYFSYGSG